MAFQGGSVSVLFEPEGWKARRSMESVYLLTLGRCLLKGYRIVWVRRLDDIKGDLVASERRYGYGGSLGYIPLSTYFLLHGL